MPESTAGRGALRILQGGAIAIVLAAATYRLFELDRYFVPKELVLHITALAALIALVQGARRLELTRLDTLLGTYLLLGVLSAILAENHWAAARALGITFSTAADAAKKAGGKNAGAHNPEETFKKLDTNGDGFLSLEEFKAGLGL